MKKQNKTRFAKRALEEFSCTMIELLSKKPFENIMVSEICDLTYHILVLMAEKEINLGELNNELSKRRNKINNFKGERKSIEEF